MNIAYIVNAAALVAVTVADLYDIKQTVKGIKAGVGVEDSFVVTTLARTNKPSFWQLLVINMLIPILPLGLPGLLAVHTVHSVVLSAFSITALLPGIYSHIHGGRDWQYLLNGGNPETLNPKWWQKVL